jgi:hypothetical protein
VTMRSFRSPFSSLRGNPVSGLWKKGRNRANIHTSIEFIWFPLFRILPVEAIESFGRLAGSYSIRAALKGEIPTQVRILSLQMETFIKIHLVWIIRI